MKSILKPRPKKYDSPRPPPTQDSPRPTRRFLPEGEGREREDEVSSRIEPPPRDFTINHHPPPPPPPQPMEKENSQSLKYPSPPLSEPKKISHSLHSSPVVMYRPGLLRQVNYYNEKSIDFKVKQEIKDQIEKANNKHFVTFFSYIKDNDLKRLIASIEQGDHSVPYFPDRQLRPGQHQMQLGHWNELVFSAAKTNTYYEFRSQDHTAKAQEEAKHHKEKYKDYIHEHYRYLPAAQQKYYELEDICEVLKYVTSEQSASKQCDKQFVRIRKWEVMLDESETKIIDCCKPNFGHTYYLYYNENYGFLDYEGKCFVKFGSSLLDLGWFFEDIMPRTTPPYSNRNIIKSFVEDPRKLTHDYQDFYNNVGENVYVRQYTFFADVTKEDGKPYTITDTSNNGNPIQPKILFTIDVSNDTAKYNMSMMGAWHYQRLGRNSFKDKKCFSNENKKNIISVLSHKPEVKLLVEREYKKPIRVYGGKNKRKVSKINKKDVLGKQRNIYKFVGDKKEYIKYKNEYVLLKKYKEMQKTKSKPKTKPKTKSKSKK